MSIPPVPNHPPRPGRRKPAEEAPDSITTQLFLGQDKPADADGSTQALSAEELERLRSMVSADGAEATEVLSLEELRALAAETAAETAAEEATEPTARKVSRTELSQARTASAPRRWNGPHYGADEGFGAAVPGAPQIRAERQGEAPTRTRRGPASAAGPGYGGYGDDVDGPGRPLPPGGPAGADGGRPGGPGGPGGPRREPETRSVPAWLWVLTAIALVLTLGIIGYIVWDATQNRGDTAAAPVTPTVEETSTPTDEGTATTSPPAAVESFASPSGNIECTIDEERARCVIGSFDYTPPERPAGCQMESWGSVVVANGDGAGFSCREAPGVTGPARVLGYGDSITASGMTCTSAEEGMTCASDDTGVGFTVRRASVSFLGD